MTADDYGNARIGERMRKYFPIDDDATDAEVEHFREMHAHTLEALAEDAAVEFTPLQEVGFATIRANMKKRKRV